MKRILYFEPGSDGHRSSFLSAVLRSGSTSWIIACPQSLIDKLDLDLLEKFEPIGSVKHIKIDTEYSGNFFAVLAHWRLSQKLAKQHQCVRIFYPMIDSFVNYHPLINCGTIPVSGIQFRPIDHYKGLSPRDRIVAAAKRWLTDRFLSKSRGSQIFVFDRFYLDWARGRMRFSERLRFIPDFFPVTNTLVNPNDQTLRKASSGRVRFLLFGALQRRKGVFDLLNAIQLLDNNVAKKCEFRFCGVILSDCISLAAQIDELRSSACPNIDIRSGFISDTELAEEVSSADVILAPYRWHKGSSGVLYWAAAFQKPVIGQDFGLIGLEITKYRLGIVFRTGDAHSLRDALTQAVVCKGRIADNAEFFHYLDGHSPNDFIRTLELELDSAD